MPYYALLLICGLAPGPAPACFYAEDTASPYETVEDCKTAVARLGFGYLNDPPLLHEETIEPYCEPLDKLRAAVTAAIKEYMGADVAVSLPFQSAGDETDPGFEPRAEPQKLDIMKQPPAHNQEDV